MLPQPDLCLVFGLCYSTGDKCMTQAYRTQVQLAVDPLISSLITRAKLPWSWLIPREVVITLLCSPKTQPSNAHKSC